MKISQQGISLEKHFESIHDGNLSKINLQPKMDSIGIWTVGWGHALFRINGNPLKGLQDERLIHELFPQFENMTMEQAEILLKKDNEERENFVAVKLKVIVSQPQFDALVCHTFNTGGSNDLFSLINQKSPIDQIKTQWENHYITGGGIRLAGLVRRRKSEFTLFSSGTLNYYL